jgi:hypothetical protein
MVGQLYVSFVLGVTDKARLSINYLCLLLTLLLNLTLI